MAESNKNNVANVSSAKGVKGGYIFTAPVGTALPTDYTTALPEAWKCLGYISEDGYVETLMHRRRALPELKSSNHNLRAFGERVALNMPIQGTAADIMKLAMVAVEKRLKKELPEAKLVLQVHDELIVECPEPQAEAAAKLLEEEMEQVAHLSVPLTAEAHWGRNWLEAKG